MSEQREQKFDLIENNTNAVRAVMTAVESTIGPKGLDTMLVDQFGNVVITNDGVTILNMMEVLVSDAKNIEYKGEKYDYNWYKEYQGVRHVVSWEK